MSNQTVCRHLSDFTEFYGNWNSYSDILYEIFKKDFIDQNTYFKGKLVKPRWHKPVNNKHESFFHLTHKNSTLYDKSINALPDLDRCKRIKWCKEVIEHYSCVLGCCSGIKYYVKNGRMHLFFEEMRYVVVLEEKDKFYFLITAHYIDENHTLRKHIKSYNHYKNAKGA